MSPSNSRRIVDDGRTYFPRVHPVSWFNSITTKRCQQINRQTGLSGAKILSILQTPMTMRTHHCVRWDEGKSRIHSASLLRNSTRTLIGRATTTRRQIVSAIWVNRFVSLLFRSWNVLISNPKSLSQLDKSGRRQWWIHRSAHRQQQRHQRPCCGAQQASKNGRRRWQQVSLSNCVLTESNIMTFTKLKVHRIAPSINTFGMLNFTANVFLFPEFVIFFHSRIGSPNRCRDTECLVECKENLLQLMLMKQKNSSSSFTAPN